MDLFYMAERAYLEEPEPREAAERDEDFDYDSMREDALLDG